MEEKIQELMCSILGIDRDSLLGGLDKTDTWNSMQFVELLFAVEDEFEITFAEDDFAELDTPKKFIEAILRKVS